jgi:hypothetical protein
MTGKGTTRHTVRVPDEEWAAAQNAASVLRTDVSTEIRHALRALVKRAARTAKPDTEETQP